MHSLQAVVAQRADKTMSAELRPGFCTLLFSLGVRGWDYHYAIFFFFDVLWRSRGICADPRSWILVHTKKAKSAGLGYGCACVV